MEIKVGDAVIVSVDVTNTSNREGDEVVQLYIHQRYGSDSRPKRLLKGFERITLKQGAVREVSFTLGAEELSYWSSNARQYVQDVTTFDIWVGTDSKAALHTELAITE